MNSLMLFNPTFILIASIFLLLWVFLYAVRRRYRSENNRLPFTRSLLRAPGQSLLAEIDTLNREIGIYAPAVPFGTSSIARRGSRFLAVRL